MATKKKASTKKKTTAKKAVRAKTIKQPYTRSALLSHIANDTGLAKNQVAGVFDALKVVIEGHVKQGSAQVFTLPGLLKIKVNRKPATKARKGINPFTGEEMMFKAKPARNVVKVQALKALKDMAK